MNVNWIGPAAAAATFFAVWAGHVTVRKVEARVTRLWPAVLAALVLGLALLAGALASPDRLVAAVLGIVGTTALWDALELRRQERRVARGHARANADNPRHASLLAAGAATTVDWLAREPAGHPVGRDEALALLAAQPGHGRSARAEEAGR
jgi:hypothetical protein